MDYTDEQLKAKYDALPEDVQTAIASVETESKVFDVGKAHNLFIDQIGELVNTVGLVLLGAVPTSRFTDEIKNRLKIDQQTAEAISLEVNSQIFVPIRESLKKLSGDQTPEMTKEAVLKEIESPAPTTTMFEKKLSGQFSLPTEPAPPAGGAPADTPKSIDPYREPIA